MTPNPCQPPQPTAYTDEQDAQTRVPGINPQRGNQAMTAAQRQHAYRLRRKSAVTQAIGEEANASRVTLLKLLSGELALLDDANARLKHQAVRNSAKRVLRVLVTRYAIDLADES